jgi:dethiobiotin synthetase
MNHLFVTGTDTEVGKTYAACALIHALRANGLAVAAMKPVAAGTDAQGHNEDVELLRAAATVDVPREWMTPYLFAPPIAPHLAAAEAGQRIDLARIGLCFEHIARRADAVVVEGVGGFRVPLNEREDAADLAAMLGLPVVMVVGLRLGCLNHALLTAESIERRGLRLAGWIGNAIDPAMARPVANVDALRSRLAAPCLGLLPHDPARRPDLASPCLDRAALVAES